jgi:transposase, IS30 family
VGGEAHQHKVALAGSTGERTGRVRSSALDRRKTHGPGHLTHEQKRLAFRLRARGWSFVDIGRGVGCTAPMIGLMDRDGEVPHRRCRYPVATTTCLRITEREHILVGLRAGDTFSAIARGLGRHPFTVSREVDANGGRALGFGCEVHANDRSSRPPALI